MDMLLNKSRFLILLLLSGTLIFGGCFKTDTALRYLIVRIDFSFLVMDSIVGDVVEGEPVYYRIFKYNGTTQTVSDLVQDTKITDADGRITESYQCTLAPNEIAKAFFLLNGYDDPNPVIKTVNYDEALAKAGDSDNAVLKADLLIYKFP